jgi:hypothetical protein
MVIVPLPEALVVTAGTSWLPLSITLTSAAEATPARVTKSIATTLPLARRVRLISRLLSVLACQDDSTSAAIVRNRATAAKVPDRAVLVGGVEHEARKVGVVHGHGIAADQIDGDRDAAGGRYALTGWETGWFSYNIP